MIAATPKTAKVLIVDDHPIVRRGLGEVLTAAGGFAVAAETDGLAGVFDLLRQHRPDLLLTDITLKDGSGVELVKQVLARYSRLRVLVCSIHDENLYAERVLQAGAHGYLRKDAAPAVLVEAARHVLGGHVYLSAAMQDRLLRRVARGEEPHRSTIASLSDRELEVFERIGRGETTQQIAERLHLSAKTIETYRQHLKAKLGIDHSPGLTVRAAQWVLQQQFPADAGNAVG